MRERERNRSSQVRERTGPGRGPNGSFSISRRQDHLLNSALDRRVPLVVPRIQTLQARARALTRTAVRTLIRRVVVQTLDLARVARANEDASTVCPEEDHLAAAVQGRNAIDFVRFGCSCADMYHSSLMNRITKSELSECMDCKHKSLVNSPLSLLRP
jgi:hypothetical protein